MTIGGVPGLVNVYNTNWKDPPCLMGKFTISMAIFDSYVTVYQRGTPLIKHGLVSSGVDMNSPMVWFIMTTPITAVKILNILQLFFIKLT